MANVRPRPVPSPQNKPAQPKPAAESSPAKHGELPEVNMPERPPEENYDDRPEDKDKGAGAILGKIFRDMAKQQLSNFADSLAAVYSLDPGTVGDLLRETAGEFCTQEGG